MKKLILLALAAIMMAGCTNAIASYTKEDNQQLGIQYGDSCEYWLFWNENIGHIPVHKGNCRFCQERRQQELEELVTKLNEK